MGGGNKQHKKFSGFSIFNIFRSSRSSRGYNDEEVAGGVGVRKMWASDEDKGGWVADPRIDTKATAFIANFKSRVSEPEHQTVAAI